MDKKLEDVLQNQYENYILPFFWLHGEDDEILIEELEKIYQAGIRAVCIESRPHEGFCGEEWWKDMDLIISEAEKRGMKVWLLDDKHFPTGFANGLIKEKYPHLRKWHIKEQHIDVAGPMKNAKVLIKPDINKLGMIQSPESSLLCVVAYRRVDERKYSDPIDLTDFVKGDFLYWDIPAGYYRIFIINKTREGAGQYKDYIHMIDPESVDVLIEAVYEPHYQRYKEHFGKTFAGFFSDEPCFGNTFESHVGGGPGLYDYTLGIPGMPLPWRDDLINILSSHIGENAKLLLPGLWFDIGEKTSTIRYAYMDIITRLYRECFSMKLGGWSRQHGVEYIGHIIEDMNAHTRLGCSTGHFFRSLDGQDMSGIDVVLHQIIPGFDELPHSGITEAITNKEADPAFYNYVLAKLASSHSHINPRMKGRAMCEIFGAYGWGEGLPLMKWLIDHMLVRGINHFVPHAFSPKEYDPDCPPHFYARGQNPQYRDFKILMEYTNKMCHLLSGGLHIATAAILYHAEAEWCGGKYMFTQVPAKTLYDEQIDFDIIPADILLSNTKIEDRKLLINNEKYDCLIIPYSQILPFNLIKKLSELAEQGVCVIYVNNLPEKSAENLDIIPYIKNENLKVIPLENLSEYLIKLGYFDIRLKNKNKNLQFYHYERENYHYYMFFNEGLTGIEEEILMPFEGKYLYLDFLGDIVEVKATNGNEIKLKLAPYQSCVIVFGDAFKDMPLTLERRLVREIEVKGPYNISIANMNEYPNFRLYKESSPLIDITGPHELPNFSGLMKYITNFVINEEGNYVLDLGVVGDTARVKLNGKEVGIRICPPYLIDITKEITKGENILEVEVATTLVFERKDVFSCFLTLPPSGLIGPVRILKYE
ncbi:MAG TPA: glycosyl hydrolase [Defluviitoga tunisiensis]|nr:glycosyl hydrolase [Defluviitoga tunisiensis]